MMETALIAACVAQAVLNVGLVIHLLRVRVAVVELTEGPQRIRIVTPAERVS